jgi:uncharacterized protein (DUF433 family)
MAVERDPGRVGGVATFGGTRVPIYTLFHYLADEPGVLDEFFESYPTVEREQVLAVLELAKRQLTGNDDVDDPIYSAD